MSIPANPHTNSVAAPTRARLGLVLTACCLGQLMFVLDVSALNVSLPVIFQDLGFSQTSLQWVISAYAVVLTGFLLLGGRLADLYGRRRVFLTGIALFTLASLAGGLAVSGGMLVVARGLQGLGAAIMVPATLAIIGTMFTDPTSRSKAFGLWSAVAGGGATIGVIAGGTITELVSWRGALLLNVPIGLVLWAVAWRAVTEHRRTEGGRVTDLAGALSVTLGLMALVYGVSGISDQGWTSARVLGGLAIAVVLLVFFVVDQAKTDHPLVPLGIFRNRPVSVANVATLLANAALGSMFYFIALLLQQVLGYSPTQTGMSYLPLSLGIFAAAVSAGPLVPRIGPRPVLVTGLVIAAAGMTWLSFADEHTTFAAGVLGPLLMIGIGEGLALTSSTGAATVGLPEHQQGLAAGLLNTTRQLGGAVGLVVLVAFVTARITTVASTGAAQVSALASGYGLAFQISAVFLVAGAFAALALPRKAG